MSVLDYLTLDEQAELDAHLLALEAVEGPLPHVEYQQRPEDWIVEKLGIPRHTLRWSLNPGYKGHVWDGSKEPLVEVMDALARWDDVGVEAGVGTQKSFTAACLLFWFLACWKNSLVNTYAPKGDQLRLYIWKEIAELWPRFHAMFPTAERVDLRIRMNGTDKWAAHGISTEVRAGEESATRAQGAHAEHMLLITEETPGMEAPVMVAIRNTRTGAHNIQLSLGNPDHQQDTLHRFCTLPDTVHVIISGLDHPNVVTGRDIVPGAQSREGIRRIVAEDEPGTPMYDSRVRGISPAESTQALIKLAWVQAAAARYEQFIKIGGPPAMGVDVANSEKGDKSSRAHGRGPCLVRVVTLPCPDSNVLGKEVFDEANELGIDPQHIGVDPVGVGAGTVNEMVRLGMNPQRLGGSLLPITGAQRAADGTETGAATSMDYLADANLFKNLRAQMAWQLREDFRKGTIAMEPRLADKLARQLTSVRYEKKGGKVILELKEKTIERIGQSPDDFDSIMYWNWVRPRSAVPKTKESGDDQHPGFDYKRKRKLRKTAPVNNDGTLGSIVEDDLRPNRWASGLQQFKMPRWGATDEEEDNE